MDVLLVQKAVDLFTRGSLLNPNDLKSKGQDLFSC